MAAEAPKKLTLRCKTRASQTTITELTSQDTIADLCSHLIAYQPEDSGMQLKVLVGYPPRELNLHDTNRRLSEVFQERDNIILEEVPVGSETKATQQLTESSNGSSANQQCNKSSVPAGSRLINGDKAARPATPQKNEYGLPGLVAGELVRRPVPANNSCLFTSVYFCLSGGDYNHTMGITLRQLIADAVAADKTTYSEAFLGRPNAEYCKWILDCDHWGGAIELAILAAYYSIEIVAVDIINLRINRFGEDKKYPQRMILIYDGIHYDPLMWQPSAKSDKKVVTMFDCSPELDAILDIALGVAAEAKASRQYTDVTNFTLRCLVCNRGLRGQKEASEHAKQTGHINFGET